MDRMRTWPELIRRTRAVELLKLGRHEEIQVQQELRCITDDFLRGSLGGFSRRRIEPRTIECWEALYGEMRELYSELYAREVGLVACMHVLLPDHAAILLEHFRPNYKEDPVYFRLRAGTYLRALLLCCPAQARILPEEYRPVIKDLLNMLAEYNAFPSIMGILRAVESQSVQDHLPVEFIEGLLDAISYKQCLHKEIRRLRRGQRWHELYGLVNGLPNITPQGPAHTLVKDLFPDADLWIAWNPDKDRIRLWKENIMKPFRLDLAEFVALEGPDVTTRTQRTFRASQPGAFQMAMNKSQTQRYGANILDHMLDVFDLAIKRGPVAISLFTSLCGPSNLCWLHLEQVQAGASLTSESDLQKIHDLLCPINEDSTFEQLRILASGLSVIQRSADLQLAMESPKALAKRTFKVLTAGQLELYDQLQSGRINELYASYVGALGRAMRDCGWLHQCLKVRYLNMLNRVPSQADISFYLRTMRLSDAEATHAQVALEVRLCGMTPTDPSSDVLAVPTAMDNPAWVIELEGKHRKRLRDLLYQETTRGLSPSEAVACINQSQKEHETFVEDLCEKLAKTSDMVCVSLASYLGERRANDCWRNLLMHLMQRQCPGLLERCEAELTLTSWFRWTTNLEILYGEQHFDMESGLGFTRQKFEEARRRKLNIGRGRWASWSVRTTSTNSTD